MSLGIVMLAHRDFDRAAQVARCWVRGGCPVVIHVDARVPKAEFDAFKAALADTPEIVFCARHASGWASWGLVEASKTGARTLLTTFPRVDRVFLASGSCLPLRPPSALSAFLDQYPDTDFIESVRVEDVSWVVDGLHSERFTLHFPFNWRKQRRAFDLAVTLQRRLGLRRTIPDGLDPHLGSQWWCLTRDTLEALFNDTEHDRFVRYFKRTWIPDESYFQTLVRRYGRRIESRSLTLSKFEHQGRPHSFYDDHLGLLQRSGCFVARKAWPRADRLYDHFLDPDRDDVGGVPQPGRIARIFTKATEKRIHGRPGLFMQSSLPHALSPAAETAVPYTVLAGFDDVISDFRHWLGNEIGRPVHGRLYHPEGAQFAGGGDVHRGCLAAHPVLRDTDPVGFLTNLLWTAQDERQVFSFGPQDTRSVASFLARDSNAEVFIVTGAWIVPLYRSNAALSVQRYRAAKTQAREAAMLRPFKSAALRARVKIWSLAEFIENPMAPTHAVLSSILGPETGRETAISPPLADLSGLPRFVQRLRNEGMDPYMVGDFPHSGAMEAY